MKQSAYLGLLQAGTVSDQDGSHMRFLVAILLGAFILGLGYTYSQENAAPIYLTAPVERGTVSTLVKANGTVEAVISVDVSSQLSGRIAAVFVGFNDAIKAGQPIAQLDQEIFSARVSEAKAALRVANAAAQVEKAALERAKIAVANAQTAKKQAEAQSAAIRARQDELERDFQRKFELKRTGSGTERDLSQARAQRDAGAADLSGSLEQIEMKAQAIAIADAERNMAEANLENAQAVVEQRQATLDQARVDLDRTVLRAPIDGIIIKRDVNPGQTVAVSLEAKTLFKIANDLRQMEVHGKIDEADVGQLKAGQAARFTVDAYPDRTFSGQVLQIRKAPEVVQNVVTYTTIVSAPNPDLLLLPGMTAQLRIVVSDTGEVLKIPAQGLRFRPTEAGSRSARQGQAEAASSKAFATVWLVGDDGQPKPIAVKLGATDDNGAELLDGQLAEGQQLIIGVANTQTSRRYLGVRLGF
jgi:HlyD family secretion protein